jgi:hypothetical protein
MRSDRRLQFTIAFGASLIMVGTPAALSLVYIQDPGANWSLAFERVNAWPWFRGSAALAVICCLWPFQALWFARLDPTVWAARIDSGQSHDHNAYFGNVMFGVVFVPPVAFLFMHPGTSQLGLVSDPWSIFAMAPPAVVLYSVAGALWKAHEAFERGGERR